MDEIIFYNLNDVNIDGYYRISYKDYNEKIHSADILILYKDNSFYDAVTNKKWKDDELNEIKLQMHLFNDTNDKSCWIKLLKKI